MPGNEAIFRLFSSLLSSSLLSSSLLSSSLLSFLLPTFSSLGCRSEVYIFPKYVYSRTEHYIPSPPLLLYPSKHVSTCPMSSTIQDPYYYAFRYEDCVVMARSLDTMFCPAHGNVPLQYMAPDTVSCSHCHSLNLHSFPSLFPPFLLFSPLSSLLIWLY